MLNFNTARQQTSEQYEPPAASMKKQDPVESFLSFMSDHGLTPGEVITDGKLYRFDIDKKGDKAGWYVFHLGEISGAGFGNWKTGDKWKWCSVEASSLTYEQRKAYQEKQAIISDARKKQKKINQEKTKKEAQKIWKNAKPVEDHPYLKNKKVKSHFLRESRGVLLVPMLDENGVIWNVERIPKQKGAKKKGLKFGRRDGLFFEILGSDQILICEGFSTGATCHQATGATVFCAFNAGNLPKVAKLIKTKYPARPITIAADNDLSIEARTRKNSGREAAERAARAINAKVIISPIDSDFNDLYVKQGIEAVKDVFEQVNAWEPPVSLSEKEPPIMPPDVLPGVIGKMCRAVSDSTETPIELAVGLILPVVAATIHNKFKVRVKPGYYESLAIWTVVALESGNRKSAVQSKMVKPLIEWESKKAAECKALIDERLEENKAKEARIGILRALYAKEKDSAKRSEILKEISETKESIKPELVSPRVWAQDITPEHLGTMMSRYNESMALLSSEGGIFDIMAGRYSKGVPNLDLFLQGHAGDSVRVDRGSREPVILNHPALTLGLSPQPDVLHKIADMPGFRGRGLLARPLYFLPKSFLGHRKLQTPDIPKNTIKAYHELIQRLLDIEIQYHDDGTLHLRKLTLSKEAYSEWFDFAKAVEIQLQDGNDFEFMRDWAGKLPGAAIRLAGLLHCAEATYIVDGAPISLATMTKALNLVSIFAGHAKIVFDLMGADSELQAARRIWSWIERNQFDGFTKRDCFEALKGHFRKMGNLNPALDILEERNLIRVNKIKTGARPSFKCIVNPKIIRGWF
ncbi:MAG: DUF3987 domain-containing protein [Desulfobacteraceae bacterium]|nr:DUF3987 domain-containing protein [Desulfobacteraceae bacterium]MBC2756699.1 DUF3987 domain-containing protein [Desulfobacteraceae bacterium]